MMTIEACQTVVFGLVLSHLDYSNVILANLPSNAIHKMQQVQNMAAPIVLQDEQESSTTRCLQKLHWLLIKQRIKFKILTLVYKCINNQAPSYLQNLLTVNPTSNGLLVQTLNSSNLLSHLLREKHLLREAFSVVGLKYWNELLNELCMQMKLESFRRNLKTYLFREAYS